MAIRDQVYLDLKEQSRFFQVWAFPLSVVYFCLIVLRRFLYRHGLLRSYFLPGKTISVGNISIGGTGKSPVVIELCKSLVSDGFSPVILTRGYGSQLGANDRGLLINGKLKGFEGREHDHYGDEAHMQSHSLHDIPIVVGRNRYAAALWFESIYQKKITHWILEDGFQHLKIKRDVDLVLLDARKPYQNGFVLPMGALREPKLSLSEATHVLFTRSELSYPNDRLLKELSKRYTDHIATCHFDLPFLLTLENKKVSYDEIKEGVAVICGIAQPKSFISMLESKGLILAETIMLRDHEEVKIGSFKEKLGKCSLVITTAKDYWRNPEVFDVLSSKVLIASLKLEFSDPLFLASLYK